MDSLSQQKKRKLSGYSQSKVWKHYEKTPIKSSPSIISSRDFGDQDTTILLSDYKKRKTQSNQQELTDWFNSIDLSSQKAPSSIRILVRAFTCCGIPFSIIENLFFIEFLNKIRPGYVIPSRNVLS
ncbi:8692_t:CDS:2, partial [Rhizophagus irregularis]